jgi:hypothetical protein
LGSVVSVTGNVTGGNILTGGVVSATANIIGGNINATNHTGTAVSVSGNVTGGNLLTGGLISAATTITGGNIATAGTASATGNVTGGNFLTGGLISATGNITSGNISATNHTGTAVSVSGDVTGGNVLTGGVISATANITGGNVLTAGLISATGNITGNCFIGNGSQLTALPAPTVAQDITSTGDMSIMTYDGNLKYVSYATIEPASGNVKSAGSVSATGNVTGGNIRTVGLISATGNITANNISLTGNGLVSFTSGSQLTFGDTPVTNRYYIDATRTDTYTANGSQARPFKTIAAAQAAIATAISGGLNPEVEPIYMILLSNITENVTLATNHVYLIGQNGQIHQPIILTGNITVQPTSGTLNSNHFSLSGIEVVGGTNGKAVYVTGTFPTRLSLQDVWITANGNSGAGLYQDNSGTGTYTHGGPLKVSHNGTGDVYCFDIRNGTASFDTVETSGATQVGAAGPGATLTFNNSQLEANGDVVVETYGNGVVVVTNSVIKNSAANSYGIKLNAVANVAGTASVGQSAFNVPLGTGQAVWLDPNTTPGLSGVFAWSGASFYPGTNTTIAPLAIPGPLPVLVGTIASPILYGDITSYSVAQDWDLIDNNASALSFDTTGKAGIINIVTTNSAEGVTMSGYANVTGNVTGGNVLTAGIMSSTGNATHGNMTTAGLTSTASLSITGNTATVTTANYSIGYLNIPQISLAANTTTALTDSGKHYYSTSASNLALTIANNTSVGWTVGTAITIVNAGTANILINQDTGVSMYLAGNATAGNRVLATFGMATIMNTAANVWFINGTGLT